MNRATCPLRGLIAGVTVASAPSADRTSRSSSVDAVGHPLTIESATYGAGGHSIDVRERLQNAVRDNRLKITVTVETMGKDSCHGMPKTLHVSYNSDGVLSHATVRDGEDLSISVA